MGPRRRQTQPCDFSGFEYAIQASAARGRARPPSRAARALQSGPPRCARSRVRQAMGVLAVIPRDGRDQDRNEPGAPRRNDNPRAAGPHHGDAHRRGCRQAGDLWTADRSACSSAAGADGKPVIKLGGRAVKPARGAVARLAIEQPRLNAHGALQVGVENRGTGTIRVIHHHGGPRGAVPRRGSGGAPRGSARIRAGRARRRSRSAEPERSCTAPKQLTITASVGGKVVARRTATLTAR